MNAKATAVNKVIDFFIATSVVAVEILNFECGDSDMLSGSKPAILTLNEYRAYPRDEILVEKCCNLHGLMDLQEKSRNKHTHQVDREA